MHNAEKTIERSLRSVLNQNYQGELEIIIINDGSTDNSLGVVDKFITLNSASNIILQSQLNSGVSSARNVGLRLAKGDFICLLDSDDEWLPNKLELQLKYLGEFDFVSSCRNEERLTFPYKLVNNQFAKITLKKLLIKVIGHTSTAIFDRKILKEVGYFDEEQSFSEDANYWMRISINHKMIVLPNTLVITGDGKPSVGHSGLSSNVKAMEMGVQKNIREMYETGNITLFEFYFFKAFSYFKYLIRLFRLWLR